MKQHIDLRIRGTRPELVAFFEGLVNASDPCWTWDPEIEQRTPTLGSDEPVRVFRTEGDETQPAAYIWVILMQDCAKILNILPKERRDLTIDQCNSILIDFHERILRPNLNGLTVEMTSDIFRLSDYLPPHAATALEGFGHGANPDTGTAHPSDEARFQHFLILTHRAHSDFNASQLGDWLCDQGWDDEVATKVAIEFEQGMALLERYDRTLAHPRALDSPHPVEWN